MELQTKARQQFALMHVMCQLDYRSFSIQRYVRSKTENSVDWNLSVFDLLG